MNHVQGTHDFCDRLYQLTYSYFQIYNPCSSFAYTGIFSDSVNMKTDNIDHNDNIILFR